LRDSLAINASAGHGQTGKNNCDDEKSGHNRRASYLLAQRQNSHIHLARFRQRIR
jgi:hypothetical protein